MKILVAKALNYAASKTDTATETAKNPVDLKEGAVGIYGVHTFTISSVKYERLALITETATTTASVPTDGMWVVNVDDFNGSEIMVCRGEASSYTASNPIQLLAIESVKGAEYTAPAPMVAYIGYDNASGLLNLPSTIANRDAASVKTIKSLEGTNTDDMRTHEAVFLSSDTQYTILDKMIAKFDAVNENGYQALVYAEIVSNGTRTAFTPGSGDATHVRVVNGSTSVTYVKAADAAATIQTALADGTFVKLQGVLYKISASTTSGFTIDRAYVGTTESIAVADTDTGSYATITQHGLRVTARTAGEKIELAVGGVLENSTITYSTQGTPGSGSSDEISRIEVESLGERGNWDRIISYMPQIPRQTVSGEVYDKYVIQYSNRYNAKNEVEDKFNSNGSVMIAFPDGDYNDSGEGQGIFETIFTTLKAAGKITGYVSSSIAGA